MALINRLNKILGQFDVQNKDTKNETSNTINYKIPSRMTGLYKAKPVKGYELRYDLPVPKAASDEILVKSMGVAICGSDKKLYNWYHIDDTVAQVPFIPGHEVSGLVVDIGSNVNNFVIGDRIAVEPHLYCDNNSDECKNEFGHCVQCQINRKDICPSMGNFGFGLKTKYGGCCEYFVIKARYCYKLTEPYISWRDAALLEPMGVACNAVDRLDIDMMHKNECVLVTGCGPIGCFVINILKAYGIQNIFAIDVFDSKLEIAKKVGADYTFNTKTDGDFIAYSKKMTKGAGYGRIVECSGNVNVISLLFKIIRKGGSMVLVGVPLETIKIDNAINDWVLNSIQIRSIHGRRIFKSMTDAENLIRNKKMKLEHVVTHFVPLTEYEKAYDDWFNGSACKVVFDPTR
eukprot:720957_1